MNKTKIVNRVVTIVGLTLGAFALSALADSWVAPTSAPPSGNVSAPINIGALHQSKSGTVTFGGISVNKTTAPLEGLNLDVNGAIGATNILSTGGADIAGLTSTAQLKVTGGTPTAGSVLTSDASGNATWQTPASTGSSILMGRSQSARASIVLPAGTWTLMVNGYFGECILTPVVMKMDGVEIGRDPSSMGDQQGCGMNTVTGVVTDVGAGTKMITLEKSTTADNTADQWFAGTDESKTQINKRQFTWIAIKQ